MPGIFFIWSRKGTPELNKFEEILKYSENVNVRIFKRGENWVVGYSYHENYPIAEGRSFVEEGRNYGGGNGEYVKYSIDLERNTLTVETDFLSRLPLYVYKSDGEFALLREPKILRTMGKLTIDRIGLFEYLVFGYPLGNRTLLSGLSRVFPNFKLTFNLVTGEYTIEEETPNFEEMKEEGDLIQSFIEAIRLRIGSPNTLLLSAGMDSRLVGAGLKYLEVPFKAIFFTVGEKYKEEIEIVRETAERLGVSLIEVKLKEDISLFERLSVLKDGLDNAGAFMLHLFDGVERSGIFMTGDGGDKVLPDLRPPGLIMSIERLADFVLEENALMRPSVASRLVGKKNDFKTHLIEHLLSYPEKNKKMKYVHFLIMERGFRWLFEGEDRNRFFVWSTTPFYDKVFFLTAMSIDEKKKRNYRLFRKILEKLSPSLLDIPYVRIGTSITSPKGHLYFFMRNFILSMPGSLKNLAKKMMKPQSTLKLDREENIYLHKISERHAGRYLDLDFLFKVMEEGLPKPVMESLLNLLFYLNYMGENLI